MHTHRYLGTLLSYFQAVVSNDAEERNDRVENSQDAQGGLHVPTAFLQDIVNCNDSRWAVVQAANFGIFT